VRLRKSFSVLGSIVVLFTLSGAKCYESESDECVAAKKHMCDKIPDMNCYAAFMDNAQTKIADACGQAELEAYIPAVQSECSASRTGMDCDVIAGKKYSDTTADTDGGSKCDAGTPMKFTYPSGNATADGRSAQMEFYLSGTTVTGGSLKASAVCGTSIQLPRTEISFTGSVSGIWESATGSVVASWTGGEYACDGTKLTAASGYPTEGTLTITMVGGKVRVQRNINNAYPYEFTAINQMYTPSPTTCAATDADTAGRSGSGGYGYGAAGTAGYKGGNGGYGAAGAAGAAGAGNRGGSSGYSVGAGGNRGGSGGYSVGAGGYKVGGGGVGGTSTTGGCAALQACCDRMTDAQMKNSCNMALGAFKGNDQYCLDGVKTYQQLDAC
jgi:hypothetical protein